MTTDASPHMPSLTIGSLTVPRPIIQGGMAVRISMAPLAAAVASAGGVGVVAGSGLRAEEFGTEVAKARAMTDGVLAANVMVAVTAFAELVHAAIDNGVDMIIAGAGFSRDVFAWCADAGVEMVPVVGSARVARLAERFGASAVVLEGFQAGGHLGTDELVEDLLPGVLDAVDIPVLAAGGVVDGADIHRMLAAGAAGVQMGSRFLATEESSAPAAFKQMYVDAREEDIVLVPSPVGLLGRAIRNPFVQALEAGDVPRIESCVVCLKRCHKDYCIIEKLERAQGGDVEGGLVFAGSSAARVHDVLPVAELMDRLETEWRGAREESMS